MYIYIYIYIYLYIHTTSLSEGAGAHQAPQAADVQGELLPISIILYKFTFIFIISSYII